MKMFASQGTTWQSLLFACLLFALASGSKLECCEPGVDWDAHSNKCRDNSSVNLSCSADKYAVDPSAEAEEFYSVNDSNWLVSVNSENQTVDNYAPGTFCRANLKGEVRYLICFPEDPSESDKAREWRTKFLGLCSTLSAIFLGFTLLVYLMLPELRALQDKAVISLSACFMVAFLISGVPKLGDLSSLFMDDTLCMVSALAMYYSFMSAFFWLNVISLNIWRAAWSPRFKLTDNALFAIYCALGWGLPLCFLALVVIAQYLEGPRIQPGLGGASCWFNGYAATLLYFYAPILVLLSLNLVYLGLTNWKLCHEYETFDCSHAKVLRAKCTICLKLSILMGATWIFEIISFVFGETNQFIWFVPDLLNASQGLVIFIFFVGLRAKVRKLLAERRPCCIPFPKSWAVHEDHDDSENNYIDGFRLSRASYK